MANEMFYMGKRLVGKMPRHTFCNKEGRWHYPKAKDFSFYGAVIGHEYEAASEEHKLPKSWSEAATGKIHENAGEWEIEHRLTIEKKKEIGKECSPKLAHHVDEIRKLLQRSTATERTLFLTYLIQTLTSWRF